MVERPINRVEPDLPPRLMKTYGVSAPIPTHWRQASCAEVNCPDYQNGWKTVLDVSIPQQASLADYITHKSGRKFKAQRDGRDTKVVFIFYPEQTCFKAADHRVPLERDPLFVVRDGDYRGYGATKLFKKPEDWVDDFANHQLNLQDKLSRG